MKTHASFMSHTTRRAYHLILHCIFLVQCSTAQHILWNIEVWSLLALLLDVYPGLNLHSVLMCLWWQADRVTCSPGPASVVSVDRQRWGFFFYFVTDQRLRIEGKSGFCVWVQWSGWGCVYMCKRVWVGKDWSVCSYLPSPTLEAPSSKSSRVPLWELR